MRIALGSDHWGVTLKARIIEELNKSTARHQTCRDFGPMSDDAVDYPDYAVKVAESVASRVCDRGILICGSGVGMAIAANKVRGVRAAAVGDPEAARLAREHNDANVLTFGAQRVSETEALAIVEAFLATPFGGGRHKRRVDKITRIEDSQGHTLHNVGQNDLSDEIAETTEIHT